MMAKYDVLLYGATGFTGTLTARYLDTHAALAGRRWAIAGRTQAKLEALSAELTASNPEVVCVSLQDAAAVEAMVKSSKVVLTCAGPYSAYNGRALLGCCAQNGVHYSDLAGEGFWQREMIDEFDAAARASGAKIVLGGGVDSIPSDLGTQLALSTLRPAAGEAVSVRSVYTQYTGSFSGGTLNSGRATKNAKREGRLTEERENDPYILAPETGAAFSGPDAAAAPSGMPAGWKRSWCSAGYLLLMDFFMAPVNARVVRRSLALQGVAAETSYSECCTLSMWGRALCVWASRGFGYFVCDPIKFKPKSGEGPPDWLLKCGAFTVNVTACEQATGSTSTVVVRGAGDPGYGATSKMLAETGLCLALDDLSTGPAEGKAGGVLTPSTALGELLVARLEQAVGGTFMSFAVDDNKSAYVQVRS